MIVGHVLSSQVMPGAILSPDNGEVSPVLEYELGGIGLNDVTEGLRYQTWTARLSYKAGRRANGIFLSAPNTEEFLLYSASKITEFSFTFDQNMNPFLAFMQDGVAKFRWWDPTIPGYTVTSLPAGSHGPKCALDDKRKLETGTSDILLCYCRDGNLYYREQRDRYGVEYLLKSGVIGDCILVAMMNTNRVRIVTGLQDFPEESYSYRYAKGFRRRITKGGNPRRITGVNYGN